MKVTEPLLLSGTVRLASKNGLWFVTKFKFDYSNESETMDNRPDQRPVFLLFIVKLKNLYPDLKSIHHLHISHNEPCLPRPTSAHTYTF